MKCKLLFLSLIISIFSYTQTVVKGKCFDKNKRPLEFVEIYCSKANPTVVFSESNGEFQLFFDSKIDTATLIAKIGEHQTKQTIWVKQKNRLNLTFDFAQTQTVTIASKKENYFEIDELGKIDYQKIPLGNLERSLAYTTAASSNNELTSNYNVRGGSYDENLIYVNGFSIYRPLLTRSGQQEGMSFINSALVENVRFSAGGFDVQYGDKLSSVLDVKYRTPDSLRASMMASLLGAELSFENKINERLSIILGGRYRNNGYLLSSLPSKGSYKPIFADAQTLIKFQINEKITWSFLGHLASNRYRYEPQTSQTDFGIANEAYRFNIYFDGKEDSYFNVYTIGSSLNYKPSNKTDLNFYVMQFASDENMRYTIQGQYFINQLETDPSKENYGDSVEVLGIGTFLDHTRDRLNASVISFRHDGSFKLSTKTNVKKQSSSIHKLKWGISAEQHKFTDIINEWKNIDSAGYTISLNTDGNLNLYNVIQSDLNLLNHKLTSFIQFNSLWSNTKKNLPVSFRIKEKLGKEKRKYYKYDTIKESSNKIILNYGLRSGYTSINNDFYVTPRISLTYQPRKYMVEKGEVRRRNMQYRIATGLYYQPPFYREFRTFEGELNTSVKSQKSIHLIGGTDIYLNLFDRESPFKFTAEVFYKRMWDLNVFEIQNVRTLYYANNDARAFAYGLDLNIHGEFIKGTESFFKIGLLNTKEDLLYDSYYQYYNTDNEAIKPGTTNQNVADSIIVYPGYIPRPTDQLLNFGALIQDQMPGYESLTVQMGVQFGSPLPYGPPDNLHYKDTLRNASPYFRVDLGLSYNVFAKEKDNFKILRKNFTDAVFSLEVFNLLGINNILDKQWIQDVNGRFYSIPNYLTQRRFNFKLILKY
ncbi:MAG: TonB-dependent receptor plug domain-containing protein [Crocinitomicaceae bacterium]